MQAGAQWPCPPRSLYRHSLPSLSLPCLPYVPPRPSCAASEHMPVSCCLLASHPIARPLPCSRASPSQEAHPLLRLQVLQVVNTHASTRRAFDTQTTSVGSLQSSAVAVDVSCRVTDPTGSTTALQQGHAHERSERGFGCFERLAHKYGDFKSVVLAHEESCLMIWVEADSGYGRGAVVVRTDFTPCCGCGVQSRMCQQVLPVRRCTQRPAILYQHLGTAVCLYVGA